MTRIAVIGMACRYPDATSPKELWENAVAGRRAFRRLPDGRMRLEDYWSPDPAAPDRFYARNAAVIDGYSFDRVGFKVAGSTFRSADMTHWLALDMAATALADAGFPMAEGLPLERTGVVVGNTLTGEFSRASQLRLRWPYVKRTVSAALRQEGWDDAQLAAFLGKYETAYKSAFPEVDEDSLVGGLSNTIAGRICNYFDLKGGGYTVDGACSSSLLSIATACKALEAGDLDVVVAGGVDLSIDPFEIIGFAKTGALATGEMRVYDNGSNGFWPGEGCGMVVLMREADARTSGRRQYATVAGYGISSDGKGGITRPEVNGYRLALARAYERAGFGVETVALFEGHGTGTKVGDVTELTALSQAREQADPLAPPAAISSIKGMIGHTKAAAGVAGFIKAVMAVHHEVLPPSLGTIQPHPVLTEDGARLRTLRKAEAWPTDRPVRAGITAMGFGGINSHVIVENPNPRRAAMNVRTRALAASLQDAELLCLDAASPRELRDRLTTLIEFVPLLSYAQLGDLAATLHRDLRELPYRAAVVVSSPEDAVARLTKVRDILDGDETTHFSGDGRTMLGHASGRGRVGLLFPGQGSGRGVSGGAMRRRFAEADGVYDRAGLPTGADSVATEVAQPRIVTGSVAGLRVLEALGIDAAVAVGHSLGELSALHWAGAMDERQLLRIAGQRGRTMAEHSASGTMASIASSPEAVAPLLAGLPVVIGGYNGPSQTVVAGPIDAIGEVCRRAAGAGLHSAQLRVSHAFHSSLVAPAAEAFAGVLAAESFGTVERRIVSTVTGDVLAADTDVRDLLHRQIVDPVLFAQAVALAAKDVDLLVEVGPGRVLSGLAASTTDVPAVALDTDSESLANLLGVVGAAYVVGAAPVDPALFHGRLVRPLEVGAALSFLENPCERAPLSTVESVAVVEAAAPAEVAADPSATSLDLLRRLAAERAELPLELVSPDSRLLDDLHLSSITVGQVVNQVAAQLKVAGSQLPTNFAVATVRELAEALDSVAATDTGAGGAGGDVVHGATAWARAFRVQLEPLPLPGVEPADEVGTWRVYAGPDSLLAEPLRHALARTRVGGGVLVCLPEGCTEEQLQLALHAAKAAATQPAGGRFVLVEHDRGAAGLAKTLRLEAPHLRVTIAHVPAIPAATDWVVAEVAATNRFNEAFYDADGVRTVPTLHPMPVTPARTEAPLTADDVLLVTGGGKGITAECALALAGDSGATLLLLGRSDPAEDTELAANLERMRGQGVRVRYGRADVTDPAAVRAAVEELTSESGPVTALLHGAGRNEPAALHGLDMAAFRSTFAPKLDGLRAVLDAVDPERLRLLVTLGSIIGRAGLRGEAHYATANDWLAGETSALAQRYPKLRAICLEWSVWSGVGMGERLSVVEQLNRDGVVPITPDQGVAMLRRILADPDAPSVVVISGRTEGIDTVRRNAPQLPLLRFVGRPLVYYHGVELVTEVDLDAGTDLYLGDHELDGNLLMPAVFGMEAMAQVASAVTGIEAVPTVEDARFLRPIVVPPGGSTRVRIAATVVDDDQVEVVIRSAETSFAADHFRARLRLNGAVAPEGAPEQVDAELPVVPLVPAEALYGDVLFQGPRFQRLYRYHHAAARRVDAALVEAKPVGWFAGYLPSRLLLGDPGVRDTLMHGNQVCVPHATLLPEAVERIHPAGEHGMDAGELRYCATERSRDGDSYVYDVVLRDGSGRAVERWEGLRLRAVRKNDGRGPWAPALIGPYLERSLGDLLGASPAVVVEPSTVDGDGDFVAQRRASTAVALSRAVGRVVEVRYRPDGRPEVDGADAVSAAHTDGLTFAVAGTGALACDVELAAERDPETWSGLLGAHAGLARLVAGTNGEAPSTAATRVWSAVECLQKAGRLATDPLTLLPESRDGWIVFGSGDARIATFATTVHGRPEPVVFAILTQEGN
ncbi:type I polyketide synthase [Dactylosporangium sp. CS-033363]|uniref:type I polyketide synthase n=1 Tax=Dactylosporangium sp. CS-033363 TaxID=3239935 RepID=UPI003D8A480B